MATHPLTAATGEYYWLFDPAERACYECLPTIVPVNDVLRTQDFAVRVAELFEGLAV